MAEIATLVAVLMGLGCTRMTHGGMDRLYFGTDMLGDLAEGSKNFLNLKTGTTYSTFGGERGQLLETKMWDIIKQAQAQAEKPDLGISLEVMGTAQRNLVNLAKRYGYLLHKATGFTGCEEERFGVRLVGMNPNNEAHEILADCMLEYAQAKTIREKEELRPSNEKFAFRTWLIRMGWTGRETSKLRTSLYQGLSGNSAFCTEESKTRWKNKWQKTEDWDNEKNWMTEQGTTRQDYWEDWE